MSNEAIKKVIGEWVRVLQEEINDILYSSAGE
jgi:hypothetical protein